MRLILFVTLSLIFSPYLFAQQNSKTELPKDAKEVLSQKYPSWEFAPSYKDAVIVLRQFDKFNWPWLSKGDFNGDQQTDYAALITFPKKNNKKTGVVALLQNKSTFKCFWVTSADSMESLGVYDKGYKIRDENYFGEGPAPILWEFKNDAIRHGFDGKPPSGIYVYRNEQFTNLRELMDH